MLTESAFAQPLRESLRAHARLRGVAAASLLLPSAADAPGLALLAAPSLQIFHKEHVDLFIAPCNVLVEDRFTSPTLLHHTLQR